MKTKQTIYLLLILGGAAILASGEQYIRQEYAFSIGIVLLMFGIYKTSQLYNHTEAKEEEPQE